ncbi:MAG: hypothetical protein Q9163_003007 [Psora crenata]
MDFIKNAMGGEDNNKSNQQAKSNEPGNQQGSDGGGFLSGIGNKLNSAAGGGRESEKNEDYLDKGVDAAQQYIFKQGDQSNESAMEQAKDEQISDFIRDKYKSTTGNDFPVKDKKTTFG